MKGKTAMVVNQVVHFQLDKYTDVEKLRGLDRIGFFNAGVEAGIKGFLDEIRRGKIATVGKATAQKLEDYAKEAGWIDD